MTPFTPAAMEPLRAAADAPTDYGTLFTEALQSEIDALGREPSHDTLYEICNLSAHAFPRGETSDEAILNNSATPIVFRYMLDALRSYRDQIDQAGKDPGPDANRRGEFLQLAFGGRGVKRGGNTRANPWGESRQMEVHAVFSKQFHASHKDGLSIKNAWSAGFAAAYEYAFGSDSLQGREPRQIQKNRAKLESLLEKHQPRSTIFK